MRTYYSSYLSSCYGKRRYSNSRGAKQAARQAQSEMGGRAMRHYRCYHCGWIHVGHPNVERMRRLRGAA